MSNRRPNNELSSIVLYNKKDNGGSWIPLKLSIGDWVTMQPSRKGDHKVKTRYLEDVEWHWKGVVKNFKMEKGQRKLKEVLVDHVYDKKEIQKESISKKPNFPQINANCKYLPFYFFYISIINKPYFMIYSLYFYFHF